MSFKLTSVMWWPYWNSN